MELKIPLQPKQKLFREAIERYPITLYGGAKGGGKSHGLRNIFLLRRFEYPKSTGVIFRKTYPELEANHIRPLFAQHMGLRQYYNESKKILTLPNGSTLRFCYCESDKDVVNYQGQEFHDLGIDEAGQWLETIFLTLLGSNRSSNPDIPVRTALTANPGGVGHGWLKRLFIDKRYNEREIAKDYYFIQALVADNPALIDSDPKYIQRLNAEPNEALRKAYLYGDWSTQAGQFFQEISKDIHFIKAFRIPDHWNRFGAYDYGFNHPAAFGWFANDEDGNTYLYRETIQSGIRVDQFAEKLNAYGDTARLYPIVAGHDCWTNRAILRDEPLPPTVAEQFLTHGIQLKKAVIDRIQGAAQLRAYLAWQGRPGNRPKFYIMDNCPVSFETLSRMVYDPDHMEDVLKVNATEGDSSSGDDAYDMIRYGLMSRPLLTEPLQPKIVIGSPSWYQKMNENLFEQAQAHFKKQLEDQEGGWRSDH